MFAQWATSLRIFSTAHAVTSSGMVKLGTRWHSFKYVTLPADPVKEFSTAEGAFDTGKVSLTAAGVSADVNLAHEVSVAAKEDDTTAANGFLGLTATEAGCPVDVAPAAAAATGVANTAPNGFPGAAVTPKPGVPQAGARELDWLAGTVDVLPNTDEAPEPNPVVADPKAAGVEPAAANPRVAANGLPATTLVPDPPLDDPNPPTVADTGAAAGVEDSPNAGVKGLPGAILVPNPPNDAAVTGAAAGAGEDSPNAEAKGLPGAITDPVSPTGAPNPPNDADATAGV
jgi:hypothetical protein